MFLKFLMNQMFQKIHLFLMNLKFRMNQMFLKNLKFQKFQLVLLKSIVMDSQKELH